MKDMYERVKASLNEISHLIEDSDITTLRARHNWGGADVVITASLKGTPQKDAFYPEPRTVPVRRSVKSINCSVNTSR